MATELLDGKTTDRPRAAPVGKPRRTWSGNPAVVLWGTVVGPRRPAPLRRAAHHRRCPAHPHEPGGAAAGLRHEEGDRDHVRGPDHAMERGDPGPVHRLPPAAPDGRG